MSVCRPRWSQPCSCNDRLPSVQGATLLPQLEDATSRNMEQLQDTIKALKAQLKVHAPSPSRYVSTAFVLSTPFLRCIFSDRTVCECSSRTGEGRGAVGRPHCRFLYGRAQQGQQPQPPPARGLPRRSPHRHARPAHIVRGCCRCPGRHLPAPRGAAVSVLVGLRRRGARGQGRRGVRSR